MIKKWRPERSNVFNYLYESGYKHVVEINPTAFLSDREEARGNGDPYTFENVSDYLTANRSLVIAYKKLTDAFEIKNKLAVDYKLK